MGGTDEFDLVVGLTMMLQAFDGRVNRLLVKHRESEFLVEVSVCGTSACPVVPLRARAVHLEPPSSTSQALTFGEALLLEFTAAALFAMRSRYLRGVAH